MGKPIISMKSDSGESGGFRKQITPRGTHLDNYNRCIYSVSVGANKALHDVVGAYVWAKEKKKYPIDAILVGDGLYKITLAVVEGLTGVRAERKAIESGYQLTEFFARKACTKGINFIKTSALILDPNFDHSFNRIEALFRNDMKFRDSLIQDSRFYVERQMLRGALKIDESEAVDLSIIYLKQEIAIYLLLAEREWLVDFYLGAEIPTLAKIMNGEIPAAPEPLKRRVNVGLQKKKNKRAFPPKELQSEGSISCADGVAARRQWAVAHSPEPPQTSPDRASLAPAVNLPQPRVVPQGKAA